MIKADLLHDAVEYVDNLVASLKPSSRPEEDKQMWKLCRKDLQRGGACGFFSREVMDTRHGRGGWRPLRRFCIEQLGKWRALDDGKMAGHNAASASGNQFAQCHMMR